jgi:hypothetical protein
MIEEKDCGSEKRSWYCEFDRGIVTKWSGRCIKWHQFRQRYLGVDKFSLLCADFIGLK